MMGMFEAGGPVSAMRLMETGRHSHRALDAMRQVRARESMEPVVGRPEQCQVWGLLEDSDAQ